MYTRTANYFSMCY